MAHYNRKICEVCHRRRKYHPTPFGAQCKLRPLSPEDAQKVLDEVEREEQGTASGSKTGEKTGETVQAKSPSEPSSRQSGSESNPAESSEQPPSLHPLRLILMLKWLLY